MSFKNLKLLPIDNEDKFETFCVDLFKLKFNDENCQKNGRRGQRQHGVDVFCHKNDQINHWIGFQCKVRNSTGLTFSEIEEELNKAISFNPTVSEYFIVTTSRRDTQLQEKIRVINTERKYTFHVDCIFWEDIEEILEDDKYVMVVKKYYTDFFIDSYKRGLSIGRIFTIQLGVEEKYSTQYELLIGKIPILDENQEYNIYYYQGLYYLSCLQNKKIVYFTKDVYPDELEEICITKLDREMISCWINTNDIDIIIDDDNLEYRFSFTREQVRAFRERV